MSWEVVKGFCRRRTQQIRENFQGASKTEDADFDALFMKASTVVAATKRMALRLASVANEISGVIDQYDTLQQDLSSSSLNGDLQATGKKVELASQDFKQKYLALESSINESQSQLAKYHMEAAQIEDMVDDRKTKMLEFDFFRNKVASLKLTPPADTTRIPRNEARVIEWQRAYDEATAQCKKLFQHLIQGGEEQLLKSTAVLTVEVAKYYAEIGKTYKVLFASSSRIGEEVYSAVASAQNAIASMGQQVSNSATAASSAVTSAATAAVVQAAVNPGSRRYFLADDPFKTD